MHGLPDVFTKLLKGLPFWAKYLFDCGYELACLDPAEPITAILTLPRRELASGLIAFGFVCASEANEWAEISTCSETNLAVGDKVFFIDHGRARMGQVLGRTQHTISVLDPDPRYKKREYRVDMLPSLVPPSECCIEDGARVSGCDILEALFGGHIRARAFCLRSRRQVVVVGSEGVSLDEWGGSQVSVSRSAGTLLEVMQASRDAASRAARVVCVSDRKAPQLLQSVLLGNLLILDGYRSWLKTNSLEGPRKRIIIVDRTAEDFDYFVESLLIARDGAFRSLSLVTDAPPGVEAYAYQGGAL
jgi:hypothetical protein